MHTIYQSLYTYSVQHCRFSWEDSVKPCSAYRQTSLSYICSDVPGRPVWLCREQLHYRYISIQSPTFNLLSHSNHVLTATTTPKLDDDLSFNTGHCRRTNILPDQYCRCVLQLPADWLVSLFMLPLSKSAPNSFTFAFGTRTLAPLSSKFRTPKMLYFCC